MRRKLHRVGGWLKKRLLLTAERDHNYSLPYLFVFLLATSGAAVIVAIGNPRGASLLSRVKDIGLAVGINGIAFIVAILLFGVLFSLIYIPLPRLLLGGFAYTIGLGVTILLYSESGTWFSWIVAIGYGVVVWLIGFLLAVFIYGNQVRKIAVALLTVLVAAGSVYLFAGEEEGQHHQALPVATDQMIDENPAAQGEYDYTFLTYGSGDDLKREDFSESVDEVTPTVDASDFITKWPEERAEFWGFGPSHFPVNGRMWLPEGDGPFPVILMTHGNHTMENFSSDGYGYLGELLASRGFIAISVDEDYVNYSNVTGSPNDNYELRAWLILKHLQQLQEMNRSDDSLLYEKIDFDQVGLMGHSRGGQAALMAADYTTFFEDDETLQEGMDNIRIQGVVAISPTDKTIDGNKPHMNNISYLVLQGARDADISDFRGGRQFYRTTFDVHDDGFKSTLYIDDANHTQFNTSWGKLDLSLPRGIFLNLQGLLASEDQRQIAKVYMGAFFEKIFHDKTAYTRLFEDHRNGRAWLPDTTMVNKYEDASYMPVIAFDSHQQVSYRTDGFSEQTVQTPEDRRGNDHSTDALKLAWESDATWGAELSHDDLQTASGQPGEQLILTMANADGEKENGEVPVIDVELQTDDGVSVTLPLDEFMPFPPVITTDFTHFGLFDDMFREGKYERAWEPVFQTFDIPLEAFEQNDAAFAAEDLEKMKLHFRGPDGEIWLEEIGVR